MDTPLKTAIALRKAGKYEQSRKLLQTLLDEPALCARASLHIAWSYDNEGNEQEAAGWYRAALARGLEGEESFEARFGLASTLRCLGQYQQAKTLFAALLDSYPHATEVRPFYALCLYNLGENERAVQLLLEEISRHPDARTQPYKKVLHNYAQHLSKRW